MSNTHTQTGNLRTKKPTKAILSQLVNKKQHIIRVAFEKCMLYEKYTC